LSESARPREAEVERAKRLYEEYAYVLDFVPYSSPSPEKGRHMAVPTAQVVGENYFTLLEAETKPGTTVALHERLYVGKDRREKVNRVVGRISFSDLTANAKAELLPVLEELIRNQEERFVGFFNKSQPVTPRMHALELLPSIGKKSMWQIVNARERKPFDNFKDIQTRAGVSDPVKLIARRVVDELSGEGKYRLFSRTA
jgi:putative nucleotide binding protein